MNVILGAIAAVEWIAAGVVCFVTLRKWNKRFATLHDKLKEKIEGLDAETGGAGEAVG